MTDSNFWHFNLDNIVSIISFVGAGLVMVLTMRNQIGNLSADVTELKGEMKKLVDIMTNQAEFRAVQVLQGQRLDELSRRLNNYIDRIDTSNRPAVR